MQVFPMFDAHIKIILLFTLWSLVRQKAITFQIISGRRTSFAFTFQKFPLNLIHFSYFRLHVF